MGGKGFLKHFWTRRKSDEPGSGDFIEEFEDNEKEPTMSGLKTILSDSSDVIYQEHYINGNRNMPVTVVYIDGLVNTKQVNDDILKPLTQERILGDVRGFRDLIELIEHGMVYHASRQIRTNLGDVLSDVLNGSVALVFDGEKKAVTFDAKGFEKRGITEPTTENAIKGAKDSFIEVLRVNTALVRRKIRTPYLRIRETVVGRQSRTPVAVIYIENLTNEELVGEVVKRLDRIDVDGVITPGYIEEYIVDKRRTIFQQILNTERTDKFCSNIMDGRVGILIDGMPVAYVVPATVNMFFQAPEDYSYNYIISSFLRLLRYAASLITLLFPAFYVSITTFHQEMIPTVLAVSIIRSKMEVPFPTVTSVFVMLIAFEMLLEAGLRLPRAIGQAVSIIGALVVGQAAAQAKLISPIIIIVIAVTGIAGFIIPNQDMTNGLRIFRMVFVICSSIAGLYGLSLMVIVLVYHLSTIETFGVPYLSPFVANEGKQTVEDTVIRIPLPFMKKRPSSLKTTNKKRQE